MSVRHSYFTIHRFHCLKCVCYMFRLNKPPPLRLPKTILMHRPYINSVQDRSHTAYLPYITRPLYIFNILLYFTTLNIQHNKQSVLCNQHASHHIISFTKGTKHDTEPGLCKSYTSTHTNGCFICSK
jgi:hypothetical protein